MNAADFHINNPLSLVVCTVASTRLSYTVKTVKGAFDYVSGQPKVTDCATRTRRVLASNRSTGAITAVSSQNEAIRPLNGATHFLCIRMPTSTQRVSYIVLLCRYSTRRRRVADKLFRWQCKLQCSLAMNHAVSNTGASTLCCTKNPRVNLTTVMHTPICSRYRTTWTKQIGLKRYSKQFQQR